LDASIDEVVEERSKKMTQEEKETVLEGVVALVAEVNNSEFTDKTRDVLHTFARRNNIPETVVNSLIKTYESVDFESLEGPRGVLTRKRALQRYLTVDTPDKAAVQRLYDDSYKFMTSTATSIQHLENGKAKAEQEVQRLNRDASPNATTARARSEVHKVVTDYQTHPLSDRKGAMYDIWIKFNNSTQKWEADYADLDKRIKAKQSLMVEHQNLITLFESKALHLLDADALLSSDSYNLVKPASGESTTYNSEKRFKEAVEKILADAGRPNKINKVILGVVRHKLWQPGSLKARLNSLVTNTFTSRNVQYTSDDVVLVHNRGFYEGAADKGSKFKQTDFYNKKGAHIEEISAAIDAGATIVIDKVLMHDFEPKSKKKGKYTPKSKRKSETHVGRVEKFLVGKGYMPIVQKGTSDEVVIFIKKTPEAEAYSAKVLASREQIVKDKEIKEKAQIRMLDLYQRMRAYKDGLLELTDEQASKLQEKYNEQYEAVLKYFTVSAVNSLRAERKKLEEGSAISEEDAVVEDKALEDTETDVLSENDTNTADMESESEEELTAESTLSEIDYDITEQEITARAEDNLDRFLKNRTDLIVRKAVRAARGSKDKGDVRYPTALGVLIADALENNKVASDKADNLLKVWRTVALKRFSGAKFAKELGKAFKEAYGDTAEQFKLGGITKAILDNSVGAKVRGKHYYFITTQIIRSDGTVRKDTRIRFERKAEELVGKKPSFEVRTRKEIEGKAEATILAVAKMELDATQHLKQTRATVLGTVPVDEMDSVFQDIAEETSEAFHSAIRGLTEREQAPTTTGLKDDDGTYFLADSPARNLLFDKDGNIPANVAAAIGVAIRAAIKTDYSRMTLGYKDRATVARMFNLVNESDVTKAHMQFAAEHGVLLKTLSDSLGKDVLGLLGLGQKGKDEYNRGEYKRLVSDLGNTVVLIAQELKLFDVTTAKTDDVAKLFVNGEERGDSSHVTYIHILTQKNKRYEPTEEVASAREDFVTIDKILPDAANRLKKPFIGRPPTEEEIEAATSNIRNDMVGGKTPAEARKAIRHAMTTPNQLNKEAAAEFFEMYDNNPEYREGILDMLGYIPIDTNNPKYKGLLYQDKEIQEHINKDIESWIENLRDLHETLKRDDIESPYMYFNYFFGGNHRYNIDSTTINPMTNKQLDRFLVTPVGQDVTYTFNPEDNTFIHTTTLKIDDEAFEIDSSLYVRGALAQAFGVGIDKTLTHGRLKGENGEIYTSVISLGNVLLSLTKSQIAEAKDQFMRTGKFTVAAKDGTSFEFKNEHLGHALQGFQFLELYQAAKESGATSFHSPLTVETDALTSGFGNKVQQMGVIGNVGDTTQVIEHAGRIGVIKEGNSMKSAFESGVFGINDMLASGQVLDSYQNIAVKILTHMRVKVKEMKQPDDMKMFTSLVNLLPGGSSIMSSAAIEKIDKTLRTLVKGPFMYFNYAAAVSTIVDNLSTEMAEDLLKTISSADLRADTPEVQQIRKSAESLAASIVDPRNKKKGVTVERFQELLRDADLDAIYIRFPSVDAGGKRKEESTKLENYLINNLLKPTYGESVKEAFNSEFSTFIEIQNNTNDVFRNAFTLFDYLLRTKIKELRKDILVDGELTQAGLEVLTEGDYQQALHELRDVFPSIMSPLGSNLQEGVHIHSTDTRGLDTGMFPVNDPQMRAASKAKGTSASTRKVAPIIKQLARSISSGAVLPLHALDGAQLTLTINTFAEFLDTISLKDEEGNNVVDGEGNTLTLGTGLTLIHDAVTSPLPFMDIVARIYNHNTPHLNFNYSILREVKALNDRVAAAIGLDPNSPEGLVTKVKNADGTVTESVLKVNPNELTDFTGLSVVRTDKELAESTKLQKQLREAIKTTRNALYIAEKTLVEARKEHSDPNHADTVKARQNIDTITDKLAKLQKSLADEEAKLNFKDMFIIGMNNINRLNEIVEQAREKVYEEGTQVSVMVAFPGGMAPVRYTEKDGKRNIERAVFEDMAVAATEYLSYYHEQGAYKEVKGLTIIKDTPKKPTNSGTKEAVSPEFSGNLHEYLRNVVPASITREDLPGTLKASDSIRIAAATHFESVIAVNTDNAVTVTDTISAIERARKITPFDPDNNTGSPIFFMVAAQDLNEEESANPTTVKNLGKSVSNAAMYLNEALRYNAYLLFDSESLASSTANTEQTVYNQLVSRNQDDLVIAHIDVFNGNEDVLVTAVRRKTREEMKRAHNKEQTTEEKTKAGSSGAEAVRDIAEANSPANSLKAAGEAVDNQFNNGNCRK
jgi:hypothetical protein